jgi:predicted nucleotidyltransferase
MVNITKTRPEIKILYPEIAQICQEYHISKLALFGSILRDDFHSDSDIDILVEFAPGKTPGFAFIDIQQRLSQLFDRTVDLNTPQDLSRYFRDEVLAKAEVIYDKNRSGSFSH